MSAALFAYGTLECPELVAALCGVRLRSSSAVLRGYRRGMLRDRRYPGITAAASDQVDGRVYFGLSEYALQLIDQYESDEYERVVVDVACEEGGGERAFTYVVRAELSELVTGVAWDASIFREQHLAAYVEFCKQLRCTVTGDYD